MEEKELKRGLYTVKMEDGEEKIVDNHRAQALLSSKLATIVGPYPKPETATKKTGRGGRPKGKSKAKYKAKEK